MDNIKTVETIHAHLDENPTDWQARAELADLYEEIGDMKHARLQRWLVTFRRAPLKEISDGSWGWAQYAAPAAIGALATRTNYESGYATRNLAEEGLLSVLQSKRWPTLPKEIQAYE